MDLLIKSYVDGRLEFYDPLEDADPMGTLYEDEDYSPHDFIQFLATDLGYDIHVEEF